MPSFYLSLETRRPSSAKLLSMFVAWVLYIVRLHGTTGKYTNCCASLSFYLWPWPLNHHTKYVDLDQRSFHCEVIFRTHTHTQTCTAVRPLSLDVVGSNFKTLHATLWLCKHASEDAALPQQLTCVCARVRVMWTRGIELSLVGHGGRAAVRRAMSRFRQQAEAASSLLAVRRTGRRRRVPGRLRPRAGGGGGRAVAERRAAGRDDRAATVRDRRPVALPAQRARRLWLRGGSTTHEHAKRRRGLRRPETERRQDAGQTQGLGHAGQTQGLGRRQPGA